jgi:nicotinamidase-related amidase
MALPRLRPESTALLVIDVQERLLAVIPEAERLVARVARLAAAAQRAIFKDFIVYPLWNTALDEPCLQHQRLNSDGTMAFARTVRPIERWT